MKKKNYYLNASKVARMAALLTRASQFASGESVLQVAIKMSGDDSDDMRDGLVRVARLLGYPVCIRKHVVYENGSALWATSGN